MSRANHPTAAVLALLLALAAPAVAQVNPFGRGMDAPRLTAEDEALMGASADRLNATWPATPGTTEQWTNQASGNSGTLTLRRVFSSRGTPCHTVRYHFTQHGGAKSRRYDINWCRQKDNSWKIAD